MGSKFKIVDDFSQNAVIKVIGVGGGGGNAVCHMTSVGIEGVEFIGANTDIQALQSMGVNTTIQLGSSLTKGLGAGMNPGLGREAAMEDRERIAEAISGADMLFIAAGMGGGTGTGAAPVVAQIAKELGILTVAVVTKPFGFEGPKRTSLGDEGLDELIKHVDSLITIPNDKLPEVYGNDFSLIDAFAAANDVLGNAVQGIAELITRPGLINVDFADVRTVMSTGGKAMMGQAAASGDERAVKAAKGAIHSPLLDNVHLDNAGGLLVNVTAGNNLSIGEFQAVGEMVREIASDEAAIVIGAVIDPEMGDELRVTVVSTGIGQADVKPVVELVEEEPARATAVPQTTDGETDFDELQKPAAMRKARAAVRGNTAEKLDPESEDYFDVPAFLRRQND